jgi:phosphotransferase system HPr-like phosphotransfer protein
MKWASLVYCKQNKFFYFKIKQGGDTMKSITISLNSIDKVKKFVNTIGKYDGDFDLASGRYTVDAKSIMGIFSLDLSKPIRLDIYNDKEAEKVISEIKDYIVD